MASVEVPLHAGDRTSLPHDRNTAGLLYRGHRVFFLVFLSNLVCFRDAETGVGLRQLTKNIKRNLQEEVHRALQSLDSVSHHETFQPIVSSAGPEATTFCNPDLVDTPVERDFRDNILGDTRLAFLRYPWADHFFWTDASGVQRIKWSVRQQTTPSTLMCEYPFFYDALQNRLWRFTDPKLRLTAPPSHDGTFLQIPASTSP